MSFWRAELLKLLGRLNELSLATPRYVSTRTELKAIDATKNTTAFFDGNQWDFLLGNYSTHVAADTIGGLYIKANDTPATTGAWVRRTAYLSPKMFTAVGDGTADDTAASAAWFVMVMFSGLPGRVDGKFKITTHQTWDFSARRVTGFTIEGVSGANDNYFNITDTSTSPAMYWHANSQALFYGKVANFGIRTNRAGVGFQVGQDNFADAWNQCIFENILVNNGAANAANVSLRLNHVLGTLFNITANAGGSGRPAQPGAPGYGTAVELRQVIGGKGVIHAGNAVIGHKYTSGFSYGNCWTSTDIEEVTTAIACDSATALHNTYNGGFFVASTLINASTGNSNQINNANIAYYAGGSVGANLTGWGIVGEEGGSVLLRSNATGFSVGAGNLSVVPAKGLHSYGGSGTIGIRVQSGTSIADFDMTASGAFLTNYVSGGAWNIHAASATGYTAFLVNSVEIGRFTAGALIISATSGIIKHRWQSGSDLFDIDYNGDAFITNYNSGGAIISHAASAAGFHAYQVNSVEIGRFTAGGLNVSGGFLTTSHATAGIGYTTGAGGTVTQLTSKGTAVTLNRACGRITTDGAALAGGAAVSFAMSNSSVDADDIIIANHVSGGSVGHYLINARSAGAGSAGFDIKNTAAGSLSEVLVIEFAVIKAATS